MVSKISPFPLTINRERLHDLDDKEVSIAIGLRISACRRAKKITQKQLSMRSGYSTSQISQLESGLITPQIFVLLKLSKALDCDPAYLMLMNNSEEDEFISCSFDSYHEFQCNVFKISRKFCEENNISTEHSMVIRVDQKKDFTKKFSHNSYCIVDCSIFDLRRYIHETVFIKIDREVYIVDALKTPEGIEITSGMDRQTTIIKSRSEIDFVGRIKANFNLIF